MTRYRLGGCRPYWSWHAWVIGLMIERTPWGNISILLLLGNLLLDVTLVKRNANL